MTLRPAALLVAALGMSCSKVPIYDVAAGFTTADVSWFADEDTLFVFYRVDAEQGLNDESVIDITYTTDDGLVDWTPSPTSSRCTRTCTLTAAPPPGAAA